MNKSELLAKAKPILFNTPMVQATLDDRKTATRRAMKPQPLFKTTRKFVFNDDECPKKWEDCDNIINTYRYQVGDILYVRETWYSENDLFSKQFPKYYYKADYSEADLDLKNYNADVDGEICSDFPACIKWRPSIHMPKEAARIFLRVTDVSVGRLQDITEKQAIAEGCIDNRSFIHSYDNEYDTLRTAREHFTEIWNSTVKKQELDRYGWNANPWVWVIEFERLKVSE